MCVQTIEKLDYHYQGDTKEIVFFKMPKILLLGDEFKDLSMSAKLVYMLLLDRVSMSDKNNWVDKKNKVFIYYTQAEAMEKLKFSNKKVSNLFKELEENNLIQRIKQGYNKPNLIYVKTLASIEVNDTSFDGEFKYSRPNIEHRIDEKSEEVIKLENQVRELEKEIKKLNQTIQENNFGEESDVDNNVENLIQESISYYETASFSDMTSKNYTSGDEEITSLDVKKLHPNKNNINNNNINYNKSFIPFRNEVKVGMNERMNSKQFKLNVINEMYDNKELPYSFTASEIKMNVAIKELVDYDLTQANYKNKTIDDFYFSTYKLFTNALIKMLTHKGNMTLNSQNVTYSKVYDKLTEYISFDKNEFGEQYCHLSNLVDNAIDDYKKGSSKTEIKYPIKYMQSCIWNALEIGDIRMNAEVNAWLSDTELVNSVIDKAEKQNFSKSYDLQKVDEMWSNCVPSLV